MICRNYKALFRHNWHPSHSNLVHHLGGELSAKAAARVRTHLEGCWFCRVRRERIEWTISTFMEYRMEVLPPPPTSSHEALRRLEDRVDRIPLEGVKPLSPHVFLSAFLKRNLHTGLSLKLAAGLFSVSLILLFWIRLSSVPPVSASQLLQRAVEADNQQLRAERLPVVYRRLQVRHKPRIPRRQSSVTWEIWKDTTHNRVRERVDDIGGQRFADRHREGSIAASAGNGGRSSGVPPILHELEQIFQFNGMDGRSPLSAATYEQWRSSVRRKEEVVKEIELPTGAKALALTTVATGPFVANAVVQNELLVRADDWHPVEQLLKVQGEDGIEDYQLTETAYQLLALSTVTPSIFADLTRLPPPIATAPARITPPRITLPTLAPSVVDLTEAEIRANYALHRVRACLGEPIGVARTAGQIEVQGTATPERRQELITALQGLPHVTANIQTLDKMANGASSPPLNPITVEKGQEPVSSEDRVIQVRTPKLPIQDQLERYFMEHRLELSSEKPSDTWEGAPLNLKITELSNQAVSLSYVALDEAWALRRLAEKYPPVKTTDLPPTSRWLLDVMVREHLSALQTQIHRGRALLGPVLSSLAAADEGEVDTKWGEPLAGPTSAADSDWTTQALHLFSTVKQIERLAAWLFAGSPLQQGQEEDPIKRLLIAFKDADGELGNLERQIAREFYSQIKYADREGAAQTGRDTPTQRSVPGQDLR